MNNKFILSSLSFCILACNSVQTKNETTSQNIEVVTIGEQNDCHDPALDVCVDAEAAHDYSQDICK